jgi:hypothetical protein
MPVDLENFSVDRSRRRRLAASHRRQENRELTAIAFLVGFGVVLAAVIQAAFS